MPLTERKITCELELASRNPYTGDIIYTFKQTFPRLILSEVNTHLIAGKNAASSRAIPTLTQLKNILNMPFLPISIGGYKKGMQASDEIKGWKRWTLERLWMWSRYFMVFIAYLCHRLGASKQFSNRLVEPWMWVEQLWTATDVNNELMLRNHWMAEPHYHELGRLKAAIVERVKKHFGEPDAALVRSCQTLQYGEWHAPYAPYHGTLEQIREAIADGDIRVHNDMYLVFDAGSSEQYLPLDDIHGELDLIKAISAGRCAWVSYYMPGANSKKLNNVASALLTFRKLAGGPIRHLSPLMHVATPLPFSVRVANLCGWFMFRKEFEGESGGDKVVPSITPKMAKQIIQLAIEGKTSRGDMINEMTEAFKREVIEGNNGN